MHDQDPTLISTEVEEALKNAMLGGSGSRRLDVPTTLIAGLPQGVFRIDMPAHMARSWRITLNNPIVSGGLAVPMAGVWPLPLTTVPNFSYQRSSYYARVRWGVGAAIHEAFVDWRQGATFVLHGSTVQVDVVVGTITNLGAAANCAITFAACAVPCDGSQADIPGGEGPTITQDSRSIAAAGATGEYAIPPFARRLRLHEYQVGVLDGLQVRFYPTTAAADLLALYTFSASAARSIAAWDPLVPIPVPMNAKVCQLQNTAAAAKSMLLEWDLNLG